MEKENIDISDIHSSSPVNSPHNEEESFLKSIEEEEGPWQKIPYYKCKYCRDIPLLRLKEDCSVLIACQCHNVSKEEGKEILYNPMKSLNKEDQLKVMNLEDYIKGIEGDYEGDESYGREIETKKKAENNSKKYCPECKCCLCKNCLPFHKKYKKTHTKENHKRENFSENLPLTDGIKMNEEEEFKNNSEQIKIKSNSSEEEENNLNNLNQDEDSLDAHFNNLSHQINPRIQTYCERCQTYLNNTCVVEHKSHKGLLNLKDLQNTLSKDTLPKLINEINYYEEEMKKEIKYYRNMLNELEKAVFFYKQKLITKEKENQQIIKYFYSLIASYKSRSDTLNYNSKKNLLINNIEKIYSFRKKIFNLRFHSDFCTLESIKEILLFKLKPSSKRNSYLVAEYETEGINETSGSKENKLKLFGFNNGLMNGKGKGKTSLNGTPINKTNSTQPTVGENTQIGNNNKIINGHSLNGLSSPLFSDDNCFLIINGRILPNFKSELSSEEVEEFLKFSNKNSFQSAIQQINSSSADNSYASDYSCSNYFPNNKESRLEIEILMKDNKHLSSMAELFSKCSSLLSVNLSSFNTIRVNDFSKMFYVCSSLQSVNFICHTGKVLNMSCLFESCVSLKEIDLRYLDTRNVSSMKYLFCDCSSLSKIHMENLNTNTVEDMSYMFNYCPSLTKINLRSFNVEKVKDSSYMFNYCSALMELNASNFITKNLIESQRMFAYCSSLEYLDISYFDFSKIKDMSMMFCQCPNLKRILIKKVNKTKEAETENIFDGCDMLEEKTKKLFKEENNIWKSNI